MFLRNCYEHNPKPSVEIKTLAAIVRSSGTASDKYISLV